MDDATIIKALKHCGEGKDACDKCPFDRPDIANWHPECLYRAVTATADRIEALGAEVVECHTAVAGAKLIADQAKNYAGDVVRQGLEIGRLKTQIDALTADRDAWKARAEAAERDLAIVPTICFGECSGDPGVGVPDCPFCDYTEPDAHGYPQNRKCRYEAENGGQNA